MKNFRRITFAVFAVFVFIVLGCETEPEENFTVTYVTEHGTAPAPITVKNRTTLTEAQLPTLTETFNTTTSKYKCTTINKSKGNNSIRKKLIPFINREKVTPFEINDPFRHQNKVRKEIKLYSLLK